MQIDRFTTLKVSGRVAVSARLGDIPPGGRVEARIAGRIDARHAIIELRGKHVRAEFPNGVPAGDHLVLELVKKQKGSFLFKLADNSGAAQLFSAARQHVLSGEAMLSSIPASFILAMRTGGLRGVFDLNRLLLGFPDTAPADEKLTGALNSLLKKGVSPQAVRFFSYLFSQNDGINSSFLNFVAVLMGRSGRKDVGFQALFTDEQCARDEIDGAMNALKALIGEGEAGEELLAEIARRAGREAAPYGMMPVLDDDRFKPLRYCMHENSIVCSLELSQLGVVDILARESREAVFLAVYCRDVEGVEEMKRNMHGLYNKIKNIVEKNLSLVIYNWDDVLKTMSDVFSGRASFEIDVRA